MYRTLLATCGPTTFWSSSSLKNNTQQIHLLYIRYKRNYSGRFSLKGNVPHVACNVWLRENGIQIYVVLLSTNLWNSRSHTLQATCGTLPFNDNLSSYQFNGCCEILKRFEFRLEMLYICGISEWQAYEWGNSSKKYWRVAKSPILHRAIGNEALRRQGWPCLMDYHRLIVRVQ